MSEMVDRVAKAIAKAICNQNAMLELDEDECGYFDDYDNKGYDCRVVARAAIEAMREPTRQMIEAGAIGSGEDSEATATGSYEAMIAAALSKAPLKGAE